MFMSAAAVMVVLCGSMAQAAVITVSYVNIQTSSNVNFNAAGGVTNHGNNVGALGTLPVGSFFRFGIAVAVTDNANPAFAANGSTPANLGLAQLAMKVTSSDPTGLNIKAVQGNPASSDVITRNVSKLLFDNNGTPANQTATSTRWTNTIDPGDVLGNDNTGTNNLLGTGEVGQRFQISTSNNAATQNALSQFALGHSTHNAPWFNGLMFQVVGAGGVTLTPFVDTGATLVWHNTDVGDPGEAIPPTYSKDPFAAAFGPEADSVINVDPILVNIPEPAAAGMLGLALVGLVGRRRSK
jgi:hypothetical protein